MEKGEKYTNTSIFLPKMINFKTRLRRNCKIKCMCVCGGGGGGGGGADELGVGDTVSHLLKTLRLHPNFWSKLYRKFDINPI